MNQSSIGSQITVETLSKNPYPLYQQMLAHEPVVWVPAFKMWMITRRADVVEILKDAATYTMEPEEGQINPMEDTFGEMMLSIDGPKHKIIRDLFGEPFRARTVRLNYTELITQVTKQLIDEILASGNSVDLDKAFSDRLAIFVVVAALGLDVNDVTQFRDWYDDFAAAIGNLEMDERIRTHGKATYAKFKALVLHQLEKYRERPNESALSYIVQHNDGRLTTDEIVSNVALTFFGGVETATAMFSNTIWALLNHPKQLAKLKSNPAMMRNALAEGLRWESPVQSAMRFPTKDVVWHGVEIKQGEKIYSMLGAANRDPEVFKDPDRFDIERPNADKHLSFAYGPHFCFGAPLALLEGEIGLTQLFDRLPQLLLHPDYPTRPEGHEFRSTPTLFVAF